MGVGVESVCNIKYEGTPHPNFCEKCKNTCKTNGKYPVTSTLFPSCLPETNQTNSDCQKYYTNKNFFEGVVASDGGNDIPGLPPQCADDWTPMMVNVATGEYVGNEAFETTNPSSSLIPCLSQYINTPSPKFCTTCDTLCNEPGPLPKKGLSTGAIVGIVLASVVVIVVIIILLKSKK